MKMIGKYDLSSKSSGCAGLALDAKNNILFAACRDHNDMVILSATDGHIIADLPIGVGCDGATFNPDTMEAFSSQGDGTLTVIKENSPTSFVVEQNRCHAGPRQDHHPRHQNRHICFSSPPNTAHRRLLLHPLLHRQHRHPAAAPAQGGRGGFGGPGGFGGRGRGGPMVPGSFEIVVVGK